MSYQREFSHRLRAGLVGIGSHAYRNILPVMNFLPVQLVAVANAATSSLHSLLPPSMAVKVIRNQKKCTKKEIWTVYLSCVSPEAHPSLVIQALQTGLHVWVEKPAAMNSEQILQMIEPDKTRLPWSATKKPLCPL